MGTISLPWTNILLGPGSRNTTSPLKLITYSRATTIHSPYADADKFLPEGNIVFLKFN